jgi:predicted nucleic acid-binding protein
VGPRYAASKKASFDEVGRRPPGPDAALDRRDAIQPAFDALLGVVDEVLPITAPDVERAKTIVLGKRKLSARDAIHAAVMEREEITRIMTFDAGFDVLPGVTRLAK